MFQLLYLHGLHSSPDSNKVQLLKQFILKHNLPCRIHAPQLDYDPDRNLTFLTEFVQEHLLPKGSINIGIIGSSMGGFYAERLASCYGISAVLINPVVDYIALLPFTYGQHTHPYTGQVYCFSEQDGQKLQRWDALAHLRPDNLLVCLSLNDQKIPPEPALEKYANSQHMIEAEGGHAFSGFRAGLPRMIQFLFGVNID